MIWLVIAVVLLVLVIHFYLRGSDLSQFDQPYGEQFDLGQASADARKAAASSLSEGMGPIQNSPRKQRLKLMRDYMDGISDSQEIDAQITPVDAGGVKAEWVLAPGVNPARRVLYIHGGAFVMGSPKSHRNITNCFSRVANAAVLAIDYRLMPEHARILGVKDCRSAYRWLLDNGPDGPGVAERVFVGGDSAGGNLTLALAAWVRDQGLRMPDAVVGLSPVTDATFSADSLRRNLKTDAMLGPMFKKVMAFPRPILLWAGLAQNRMSPSNSIVSPVFGDLSGLPPTLLHASESEVLLDDSRRYVNKAVAAGTPAKLQTWTHMPHVWHMFYPQLPEACAAWEEIERFIGQVDAGERVVKEAA